MYIPKDQKWSLKVDKGQSLSVIKADFAAIESRIPKFVPNKYNHLLTQELKEGVDVHDKWCEWLMSHYVSKEELGIVDSGRNQNTVYHNKRSEEVLFYTDEGKVYQVDTLSGRSHLIDKLIRGQNMGVASSGSMYTDIKANIFDEDRSAPVEGFGYLQIHGEHVYRMMFTFKSAIAEGCQVDVRVFTRLPNQSQDWFKIQVMFAARRKVHGTDA